MTTSFDTLPLVQAVATFAIGLLAGHAAATEHSTPMRAREGNSDMRNVGDDDADPCKSVSTYRYERHRLGRLSSQLQITPETF